MKTKAQIIKDALKEIEYYGAIKRKYRFTNPIKDKAWCILSDYVRCRDFIKYRTCISSNKPIYDWRESDAGHFYSMGGHGAYLGFNDMNVHMQSPNDNRQASAHSGAIYRDNLEKRYGKELLEYLEKAKNEQVKADDFWFIEKIKEIHALFAQLKFENPFALDFPDYL
jgi:hypothetical protein